jgi:uncharacterized membrane protein YtjA (UPF0391 family)
MLGWAVVFLIVAIVAAVFGFGGIAAASAGIAKILFFIFLVLFIISLIFGWRGRGGALSRDWIVKVGVAEFPRGEVAKSTVSGAGMLGTD